MDLSPIVKAYDVRGVYPDQLDEQVARAVGAAFARLVDAREVVVAHDMRTSSRPLVDAFTEGVTAQGVSVADAGLASTDMMYFASGQLDVPGAMFTASHNPARYNGIKLCRAGAAPIGQDSGLADVRADVEQGVADAEGVAAGQVRSVDVLADYAAYLRSLVRGLDAEGVRGLKLVVDAGNGMAGHTADAVLGPLGCDVDEMYYELDGTFPNHEANPIDEANLADLQARVRETGADVGLAFDGDADRCFLVDETGTTVPPSALVALIADRELEREPGATVVHNLITSHAVPELVREKGGEPVRTRVGHSFIKKVMADTGAIVGGEHSGHFYFRDFWRADSGMLAALHALAALGTRRASEPTATLSDLVEAYSRYAASGEVNSEVDDTDAAQQRVREAFEGRDGVEIDELDGLTVSGPDGWWFNVRPSNTEPLLRLNVEAPDTETVERVRDEALEAIRG